MRDNWRIAGPWISWTILMLYTGLIFFLSSRPNPSSPVSFPFSDKLVHLVEYGILGYLSQRAARLSWPAGIGGRTGLRMGLILVCGLCIAGLDERFQSVIPGRISSVSDFLFDALGLGVGLILNLNVRLRGWNTEAGGVP